ncbi:MAG: VWA domain-containing protein [Chitinivibrionales bacterium]|nr:VWA domain-containing protein [Chitinivibrionales bacterium]
MRFKDPLFFLALIALIPALWFYLRRQKRARTALRFSTLALFSQAPASLRARLRHLPFVLQCLGLISLTIALARPQKGLTEEEVTTEGIDIIIVQDISTSMKCLDFKPQNRLYVAKQTIKQFISQRVSDRIGLVVFSGRSFTKCPLTLDYGILQQFVDDITFTENDDGTAIGTAIATAAMRLQQSNAKSKIMILVTDGANNRGEISPITAANAAGTLGIKIYTIGVGRSGEVPYPFEMIDRFTGKVVGTQVQMIQSDLDEQTLVNIAAATHGRFFRATNAEQLKEIYGIIDKLEKTEIKTKSYTTYSDKFYIWLVLGGLLFVLELILSNSILRKIP